MATKRTAANLVSEANGNPISFDAKACCQDTHLSDQSQAITKNYLWQYFRTYPDRVMSYNQLVDACVVGPHCQQNTLPEMIDTGVAEGWLEVKPDGGVDYYFLKTANHE